MSGPCVSIDDLEAAILWLESNEGDEAERAPMLRVAEWLKHEIKTRRMSAAVRELCRSTGATRSQAYRALKTKLEGQP